MFCARIFFQIHFKMIVTALEQGSKKNLLSKFKEIGYIGLHEWNGGKLTEIPKEIVLYRKYFKPTWYYYNGQNKHE